MKADKGFIHRFQLRSNICIQIILTGFYMYLPKITVNLSDAEDKYSRMVMGHGHIYSKRKRAWSRLVALSAQKVQNPVHAGLGGSNKAQLLYCKDTNIPLQFLVVLLYSLEVLLIFLCCANLWHSPKRYVSLKSKISRW